MTKWLDISDYMPAGFTLRSGSRWDNPQRGLCYMETVALIAGEEITAAPECACPIITKYGIALNDSLLDAERQRLLPLAWATAAALAIGCADYMDFPSTKDATAASCAGFTAGYAVEAANAARVTADATNTALRERIVDCSINALRKAIAAGPHGGFPEDQSAQRAQSFAHFLRGDYQRA